MLFRRTFDRHINLRFLSNTDKYSVNSDPVWGMTQGGGLIGIL